MSKQNALQLYLRKTPVNASVEKQYSNAKKQMQQTSGNPVIFN